ncbi:MAG: hypothetical protein N2109_10780 [Fimbriimonadales bacterium]|nr:hypothetical protein [Fimbriimonadales bacterium]
MTHKPLWGIGAATLAVGVAAWALAQGPQGPQPPQEQGFPGQFPPIGQRLMQLGQPVMTGDNQFLYILRGNQLLKVDKAELRVIREAQLPPLRPFLNNPGGPRPLEQRRRQNQQGGAGAGRQL